MMALDLSALEDRPILVGNVAAPPPPNGKAMRVSLADVEPDPNQPRTEKKDEEIAEIGEDIKVRGVKVPISIKPHPIKPGKWIINDGELRYLGSKWAGLSDIPVIVDEDFDDFDQVNVNEKRYALRPMELAKFIQGKLDSGIKKAEIAKRLRKPAPAITELLALINPTPCVEDLYVTGLCTSPKTLYELRLLEEKFPEKVREWCEENHTEVTRSGVYELGNTLKGKKQSGGNGADPSSENKASSQVDDKGSGSNREGEGAGKKKPKPDGKPDTSGSEDEHTDKGELTSWPRGKAVADPDALKKPLLLVKYDGRTAAILLNRKPSASGLVRIRYEDGGGDAEVDAGRCKISLLAESDK